MACAETEKRGEYFARLYHVKIEQAMAEAEFRRASTSLARLDVVIGLKDVLRIVFLLDLH
jgi:hypothetical protein